MNCGVGRRRGSDLVFLWLWQRSAAVALIRPLAWELPHAAGAVLKSKKQTKKKTKQKKTKKKTHIILAVPITCEIKLAPQQQPKLLQ